MCNYSTMIYLEGVEDGEKKGLEKGQEKLEVSIRATMKKLNYSLKEAMDFLEIEEEEQAIFWERIKEKV